MKRKEFAKGQPVEVQVEVDGPWEPAEYLERDEHSYHRVKLPPGRTRRINSMTGEAAEADDPRGYNTDRAYLPSRRIREPQ